jgi:hypothetical protein
VQPEASLSCQQEAANRPCIELSPLSLYSFNTYLSITLPGAHTSSKMRYTTNFRAIWKKWNCVLLHRSNIVTFLLFPKLRIHQSVLEVRVHGYANLIFPFLNRPFSAFINYSDSQNINLALNIYPHTLRLTTSKLPFFNTHETTIRLYHHATSIKFPSCFKKLKLFSIYRKYIIFFKHHRPSVFLSSTFCRILAVR